MASCGTGGLLRVTVSCHGKFHAFALSRQLAARGALERLLTSDPRVLREPGIPLGRGWTFPLTEVVGRMPSLVPRLAHALPWDRAKAGLHDRWAAAALGHPDLVVAWSGAARRTLLAAKERGAVTVLERGSTHIAHQDRVLREEAARFGEQDGVARDSVQAELAEYAIADRIMVPSRFAKRTFVAQGIPEEKVLQVPYGADVSFFTPAPRQDDVFRVIFVGGLTLRKGIYYLLEAFRRLRLPRSELVLVGAPVAQGILKRFEGVYRGAGAQDRAGVAALLRQSSVFVHPSVEEGLSLAIREALATGLPVIATPETGAEDALEPDRDGFIIPSRDIDALCERLELLYRNPELRAEMSRHAAANARRWTWDHYGDAIYAAYQQVLQSVGKISTAVADRQPAAPD